MANKPNPKDKYSERNELRWDRENNLGEPTLEGVTKETEEVTCKLRPKRQEGERHFDVKRGKFRASST